MQLAAQRPAVRLERVEPLGVGVRVYASSVHRTPSGRSPRSRCRVPRPAVLLLPISRLERLRAPSAPRWGEPGLASRAAGASSGARRSRGPRSRGSTEPAAPLHARDPDVLRHLEGHAAGRRNARRDVVFAVVEVGASGDGVEVWRVALLVRSNKVGIVVRVAGGRSRFPGDLEFGSDEAEAIIREPTDGSRWRRCPRTPFPQAPSESWSSSLFAAMPVLATSAGWSEPAARPWSCAWSSHRLPRRPRAPAAMAPKIAAREDIGLPAIVRLSGTRRLYLRIADDGNRPPLYAARRRAGRTRGGIYGHERMRCHATLRDRFRPRAVAAS